jgi:hypothetical protein
MEIAKVKEGLLEYGCTCNNPTIICRHCEAVTQALTIITEWEKLKVLNDTLTRNVFVEDSPALKVMVETAKQQKDIIASLQAEIERLKGALEKIAKEVPDYKDGYSQKQTRNIIEDAKAALGGGDSV